MNKKVFPLLVLTGLTMGLVGCNKSPASTPASSVTASSTGNQDVGDGSILEIYYYRPDANYKGFTIWSWITGNEGVGFDFESTDTKFVEYTSDGLWAKATLTFDKEINAYTDWGMTTNSKVLMPLEIAKSDGFNIIIHNGDTKDPDGDRAVDLNLADSDGDGVYKIYSVSGMAPVYYSLDTCPFSGISAAEFKSNTTEDYVEIVTSSALTPAPTKETVTIKDSGGNVLPISEVGAYRSGSIEVKLASRLTLDNIKKEYTIYVEGHNSSDGSGYKIGYNYYYSTEAFDKAFTTDVELGSFISGDNTNFKLWAPTATKVVLNTYENGTVTAPSSTYEMVEGEKGVWSYQLSGNKHGLYYSYDVTVLGTTNKDVADPYGKSANANGKHSMVVDFSNSAVLPTGFSETNAPSVSSAAAPIVYETHVRDFTMSDSWKGTTANKGKYLGLSETGTKLDDNSTKTGFDYVKDLGVTHVQLLPIYDFKSVDETKINDVDYQKKITNGVYNWGYDPQSYNAPEGSYSSDPNDGNTRVKELREAIMNYNKSGIGVIMDVVYNHMPGQADSTFDKIVPGYYFRGVNNSGAGADMASEKPMFKKYVVDSTKMWMKEYKMAGFRFDLMGLLTTDTMKSVSEELHKLNEDAIIYGEGWSMFGSSPFSPDLTAKDMATQNHLQGLEVGAFNDTTRDALKGSVFNAAEPGWATSTEAISLTVKKNVMYGIVGTQSHKDSALTTVYDDVYTGATVNYAEAHDNLTLHDKLRLSVPGLTEAEYNQRQMFVNDIILTSLGISFFHSGTEFGRTKLIPTEMVSSIDSGKVSCNTDSTVCYSNDSYNLNDTINAIDWTLAKTNENMVSEFKKAVSLKNTTEVLRSDTYGDMESRYVFDTIGTDNSVIAYTLTSAVDSTQVLYIVHNAGDSAITISDHANWKIALGGTGTSTSSISVAGHSTLVLVK